MCIYTVGPAGTGKTESVKALGHQLGRFVLVFNCDETFDFQVNFSGILHRRLQKPDLNANFLNISAL